MNVIRSLLLFLLVLTCLPSCKNKKDKNCPTCPAVVSLTPTRGFKGDTVIVVGRNFNTDLTANVVTFNEVVVPPSEMITGNTNQLKVLVPANCGTGYVIVKTKNLESEPGPVFTYEYANIKQVVPLQGRKGDTVSIIGERFEKSKNVVKFNGMKASILSESDTLIRVIVPTSCGTGMIGVTLLNGLTIRGPEFTYVYTYTVSTFAGIPQTEGAQDGPAGTATFRDLHGLVYDTKSRTVYVSDGSCIRKINNGQVSTFAGLQNTKGYKDGYGKDALLDTPWDLTVNAEGDLLVPDMNNHCIRKITANTLVTTFCGKGQQAGDTDGKGNSALLSLPYSVDLYKDSLYIADTGNKKIKWSDAKANVITVSTTSSSAVQITVKDKRTLLGTDIQKNQVLKIDLVSGQISVFAGSGQTGSTDGDAASASFASPTSIAIRTIAGKQEIYIADTDNHLIRKIDWNNQVSTVMGAAKGYANGENKNALFNAPSNITFDTSNNNTMYITDSGNKIIRKVVID